VEDLKVYPFAQIYTGAADISRFLGNLQSSLQDVSTAFNGVISSGQWSSDGAQAFNQAQIQWTNATNDMHGVLTRVQQALSAAGDSMKATDGKVAGTF
jgi:WXG100 family type VII secretion target